MAYAAALRAIFMTERRRLAIDETAIHLEFLGRTVEVNCLGSPLRTADQLFFIAHSFATESEALDYGRSLRGMVRLLAVRGDLCLNSGEEIFVEPINDIDREMIEQGNRYVDLRHGLVVYEESDVDRYCCANGGYFEQQTPESLLRQHFASVADLPPAIDGTRRALACDLLRAADSDPEVRSGFVTIVTALECLVAETPSSDAAIDAVAPLLQTLRQQPGIDDLELRSLEGRIRDLKHQSVRRTLRSVVDKHRSSLLDDEPEALESFVERCYSLRSALVHGAQEQPSESELRSVRTRLRRLVGRLVEVFAEVSA